MEVGVGSLLPKRERIVYRLAKVTRGGLQDRIGRREREEEEEEESEDPCDTANEGESGRTVPGVEGKRGSSARAFSKLGRELLRARE